MVDISERYAIKIYRDWLTDWNYRKSHVLNPSSGAGTHYQIRVKVNYGSGTDSGENVYLAGKCRRDFSDIRFCDDDKITLLDYWMESKVDGDYAVFWVEVADDLSTSPQTIYIYYGKADAATTSNVTATFIRVIDTDQPVKLALPMAEGVGSIVFDESGQGNHGTIYGATWTTGRYDKALSFNGVNNYVNRASATGLSRSALTFAFWSKQLGTKLTAYMHPLGFFGSHRATVYVFPNSYRYFFKFISINGVNYETEIATLDDKWHHIVVTFNGSEIRAYVDGVLRKTTTAVGSITGGDESIFIGNWGTGSSPGTGWFHGIVDEVRFYNRALKAEEVADLYNHYPFETLKFVGRTLIRKLVDPEPSHGAWRREEVSKLTDLTPHLISFTVECPVTSERGEARLRFDAEYLESNSIKAKDAIEIYIASQGAATTTKVFSGEVEEVNMIREEGEPYIEVVAFDWSKILSERKVHLSYPTVTNVSEIAKDIVKDITTESPGPLERKISISNVEPISRTRTIDFLGLTKYEALTKLCECTLCDFYVDASKDLNFFLRGTRRSGITLSSEELQNYEYVENRDICNHAKVFGAPNRTDPEFDLDAYSDSLEGWNSPAGAFISTWTITGTANRYVNETSPGWTKLAGALEFSQTLPVNGWTGAADEWHTRGSGPYKGFTTKNDENYVRARGIHEGKRMQEWLFEDPSPSFQKATQWLDIKLRLETRWDAFCPTIWSEDCEDLIGDFTISGNVQVYSPGFIGNCFRMGPDGSNAGGFITKTFLTTAGHMYAYTTLQVLSNLNYPENSLIRLVEIRNATDGVKAGFGMRMYLGTWKWFLYGWDKDGSYWSLQSTYSVPIGTWCTCVLSLSWAGSSAAIADLKVDGVKYLEKTGINLTGDRPIKVIFGGIYPNAVAGVSRWVFHDLLAIAASASQRTFEAKIWVQRQGTYISTNFTVYDTEHSWVTKEWTLTSYLNSYADLNEAKLILIGGTSTGISGTDGFACVGYAEIFAKIVYETGQGNPWISDDDGDEDCIEARTAGLRDYAWKNFDLKVTGLMSVLSMRVFVKARVLTDANAIQVMVKDATTGSWIDSAWLTYWETSYTTKSLDIAGLILNGDPAHDSYNIENLELGFRCHSAAAIRITYVWVEVQYVATSGFLSLSSKVKKAGNYSLQLSWSGTSGEIETSLWKDFPRPIACQTVTCKEGFTKLVFAALVKMHVASSLDHWRRPAAVLDKFTVILYDQNNNAIRYSASDLYPQSSFQATPSPQELKMKEIHVPVGSDAEADGKWEMEIGTTFNWEQVRRVKFDVKGRTDTSVEGSPYLRYLLLWIDWVHWEEGRWFAEYELDDLHKSVVDYGRNYEELFDKTCFSAEDCFMKAKYYVQTHMFPTNSLENVEIDYPNMENLKPGETVNFDLPECTISLRINKIVWQWDGDLYAELGLDNQGLVSE